MRGVRAVVGLVTMGGIIPLIVFHFLEQRTAAQFVTIAVPCFFGWCIAEFVANILERPRLADRSPKAALKEWERRDDGVSSSSSHSPRA